MVGSDAQLERGSKAKLAPKISTEITSLVNGLSLLSTNTVQAKQMNVTAAKTAMTLAPSEDASTRKTEYMPVSSEAAKAANRPRIHPAILMIFIAYIQ